MLSHYLFPLGYVFFHLYLLTATIALPGELELEEAYSYFRRSTTTDLGLPTYVNGTGVRLPKCDVLNCTLPGNASLPAFNETSGVLDPAFVAALDQHMLGNNSQQQYINKTNVWIVRTVDTKTRIAQSPAIIPLGPGQDPGFHSGSVPPSPEASQSANDTSQESKRSEIADPMFPSGNTEGTSQNPYLMMQANHIVPMAVFYEFAVVHQPDTPSNDVRLEDLQDLEDGLNPMRPLTGGISLGGPPVRSIQDIFNDPINMFGADAATHWTRHEGFIHPTTGASPKYSPDLAAEVLRIEVALGERWNQTLHYLAGELEQRYPQSPDIGRLFAAYAHTMREDMLNSLHAVAAPIDPQRQGSGGFDDAEPPPDGGAGAQGSGDGGRSDRGVGFSINIGQGNGAPPSGGTQGDSNGHETVNAPPNPQDQAGNLAEGGDSSLTPLWNALDERGPYTRDESPINIARLLFVDTPIVSPK